MLITSIHGAFSSPTAFNYVIDKSKHVWQSVDYSDKTIGIDEIVEKLYENIKNDTILVGHSLGGVIGSLLLDHEKIHGLITIGSPLGGIQLNNLLSMYMVKSFVSELKPKGKIVQNTQISLDNTAKDVYHIVTTKGFNPFIFNDNDGVVEVNSQTRTPHNKIHMNYGHNEIMTSPELIKNIDILIERIKNDI